MTSIHLTAAEVAQLVQTGALDTTENAFTGHIAIHDMVAIKEPWYRLQRPADAYCLDAEPRYIRQSEATAEPLCFTYEPPETMPMEAVKHCARVERIRPGHITIYLMI
jgi:hypothetical protein